MNSNTNSQIRVKNEISELHSAVVSLYTGGEYLEIIKLFLETIRIRLIVISELIMNHSVPSIKTDKGSAILKQISTVVFDSTGFNLMGKFIAPLSAIEDKIAEKSSYMNKDRVFSKALFRKDVLFLVDLYYMLKTFNPKCLFGENGIKSDETVDWLEKVKTIDTHLIDALPESLKFISPIATYIKNNTHKKIPFAKALPFVKNKVQSAIPENVAPVLKGFVENKFREEIDNTEREFDKTQNLNSAIARIHFLENTRKTLSKGLEVSMPKDSIRKPEFAGIQRFLKMIMAICIGMIGLNLLQMALLPSGVVIFVLLSLIPAAIIALCWILQMIQLK